MMSEHGLASKLFSPLAVSIARKAVKSHRLYSPLITSHIQGSEILADFQEAHHVSHRPSLVHPSGGRRLSYLKIRSGT